MRHWNWIRRWVVVPWSSLAGDITLKIMAVVAVACVIIIADLSFSHHQERKEAAATELSSVAEVLAASSAAPLLFEDREAAEAALYALTEVRRVMLAGIYDKYGQIFVAYSAGEASELDLPPRPGAEGAYWTGNLVQVFVPVLQSGRRVGHVCLVARIPSLWDDLFRHDGLVWILTVYGAFIAFTISYLLRQRIADPILDLVEVAKQVADGKNYSLRATGVPNNEVGVLARTFNSMLDHIQAQQEELERQQDELEKKVASRTLALKEANLELKAAKEKAEEASRLKDEFLANISHEFRTPMNGILGLTSLALETELTSEQEEFLLGVKTSAESLLLLQNELLSMSDLVAGSLDLIICPFDVRDALNEVVARHASAAAEKKLVIRTHFSDQVPDQVEGDPIRVTQVVANLLRNAIKFTHTGEIHVNAKVISESDTEMVMEFCVRDTGIGISRTKLQRIFNLFEQADGSMTRQYGGMGLGLTVSARLVELMDGKIWVDSRLEQGSAFYFKLPLRRVHPRDGLPRDESGLVAGSLTILLAEEAAEGHSAAQAEIQAMGHLVYVVSSGAEAEEALATQQFDLVLLDLNGPGIGGTQVATRIRANEDGSHTPVFGLTSSETTEKEKQAFLVVGGDGFLDKPVDRKKLARLLTGAPVSRTAANAA